MADEIRLGDTVQCKYTGLKGVALTKMEFINGCIQLEVVPKWNAKSTTPIESAGTFIDLQSLKLVKKGERWRDPVRDAEILEALEHDDESTESITGGPMRRGTTYGRIRR